MLHGQRGRVYFDWYLSFQFLLGCYRALIPPALRKLSTFNSFWDATESRGLPGLRVRELLSIPFGMLLTMSQSLATSTPTFNSFWDATMSQGLHKVCQAHAFNSFWDATSTFSAEDGGR